MSQRPTVKQPAPTPWPNAWTPTAGARAPLKEVYPWTPFPGAYMAPVPESAPTSAITIANQIPPFVLANIPADQRNAYVESWPLLNEHERAVLISTYGQVAAVTHQHFSALGDPPAAPATNNNGGNMAANNTNTDGIPADLLARIPAAERAAYAADWPLLSAAERQVLMDAYPPETGFAGMGGGTMVLLAAAAAWFFLRKK